jgi:hypothetical protein
MDLVIELDHEGRILVSGSDDTVQQRHGSKEPTRHCELLGLSPAQLRESGADGTETYPASLQDLWQSQALDHGPHAHAGLYGLGMPDESAEEVSEYVSNLAR